MENIHVSGREFAARVIRIIASQSDKTGEQIALSATLKDLGFDSFGVVSLMFALEDEFQIEITDEKVRDLKTVGDIITQLHQVCGDR